MRKAVHIAPQAAGGRRPLTIRVRLTVTAPSPAGVTVADVLLQAGGTASGWVPHVTEMPWTAGVVGGGGG
jgi:hypothetical protein